MWRQRFKEGSTEMKGQCGRQRNRDREAREADGMEPPGISEIPGPAG